MTIDELIEGEVYAFKNGTVFMWGGNDSIYNVDPIANKYNDYPGKYADKTGYREATELEKKWLKECRTAGGYIPKEAIEITTDNYEIY